MDPRTTARAPHPRADLARLAALRASYEGWLERHRAGVATSRPERRMYAWAAVANDYVQLSGILYGEGAPLDEVRTMLVEAARAHLEVVRLRGASHDPSAPVPADGYSTGSSCATYHAICRASAAGAFDLARELAGFLWDPPNARYIGPRSIFGTVLAQSMAYALRDLLLGQRDAAEGHLEPLKRIPEDLIGELLLTRGLVRSEPERVSKGLGLALAWHAKDAAAPHNATSTHHFLCLPATGLAALGVHFGVIAADALRRDEPTLPFELIAPAP